MNAYSPLAFAVAQASTTEHGILFIQTNNNGSNNRYYSELHELAGDILNVLIVHDIAIVTDISFHDASEKLSRIIYDYDEGSCLSIAAMFIKTNGQIAASWCAGQDGKAMSDDQGAEHAML